MATLMPPRVRRVRQLVGVQIPQRIKFASLLDEDPGSKFLLTYNLRSIDQYAYKSGWKERERAILVMIAA